MSGRNELRRAAPGGSRGLGLAEALVALTVLALAASVAFVLYDGAQKSFKIGDNLTEQQQVVRIAFDEIAGDLRLAGFNSNPDGDTERPDEQIELAAATAIVFRADFDADDPVTSIAPEEDLADITAGAMFRTVSTGNDEIVAYVLAKPDSNDTLTFEADLLPSVRDGGVETVEVENVALLHDDPPYTLYRVTFDENGADVRTPVIDNVRFLNFRYFDGAGTTLAAAGGMDDMAGVGRVARASIRRVGIELEGLTRDAHVGWNDPHDPVPGPGGRGQYRKFNLSGDVTPRNLGMFGVKDLDASFAPPSTPPPPSLHAGHCQGLWLTWAPNPPQDEVARYELRYGTDPNNLAGPDYAVRPRYYLDGLLDGTQYYVTVQAVDDSGDISLASEASHETTINLNFPEPLTDLSATQGAEALDNEIRLSWSEVTDNEGTPYADPIEDPLSPAMRDFSGYWIHRDTESGFDPVFANRIRQQTPLAYTDNAVVNCRTYFYQVLTVDLCGEYSLSEPPEEVAGNSTHFVDPAAPINVQAQYSGAVGASHVRVEWDPVVKDVNGTPVHIEDYWLHRAEGAAGTPLWELVFSRYRHVEGATSYQEGFGSPDSVMFYRVTALDDCVNESIESEIVSADCTFSGEVAIVEPLDHNVVHPGDPPLSIRVDVQGAGAAYDGLQLKVVDISTGLAAFAQDVNTAPPWLVEWDAGAHPIGDYRIDASVKQSGLDGCLETTSRFVSVEP